MVRLSLEQAIDLAVAVLEASATSPENARITAEALVEAEASGQASHGLSRLPAYADQARAGKVDGRARPEIESTADATLRVDARAGFAFPAIRAGIEAGLARLPEAGIVGIGIRNSHHAGVLGQPVERAALSGAVALGFSNSPAGIAPWGGAQGIFGTNPIAFAAPRLGQPPLVIDASLAKVARGKVMLAARQGEPIPSGWALDQAGQPTTDPEAALAGTMLPMGEAKGAALVLMVEILAAALTGSQFGFEASSFFSAEGAPPRIGQSFVLIDPARLAGPDFADRLEVLLGTILAEPGTRLPGERRLSARAHAVADGIEIQDALHVDLTRRAGRA